MLTLAVGLWLGYEVRQARQIERTLAALRELGGNGECEPAGVSLLRLLRMPGYGQCIVSAEIPGVAVEGALELLRDLRALREVHVTYDGTYDPTPSWRLVTSVFPDSIIHPKTIQDEPEWLDAEWLDEAKWKSSVHMRRLARVRARVVDVHPRYSRLRELLLDSQHSLLGRRARYQVVLLPKRILAEVWIDEDVVLVTPGAQGSFAVLLIEGNCAGVRGFTTGTRGPLQKVVLEDLDGDGVPEVGFQYGAAGSRFIDGGVRNLPGDQRNWLGVYKIERDGFKSLLPGDRSDFP